MFSRILFVAAMVMGAAACVGDVDDGTGGGPDTNPNPPPNGNSEAAKKAQAAYENEVFPIAQAKCGSCHVSQSPGFVGADKATAYNQAIGWSQITGAYTAASSGLATIPQGIASHAGLTWSTDELAKITNWLNLEAAARANGGTPPTTPGGENPAMASARLSKAFQDCMSIEDFTASQLGTRIANQQSNEGSCDKCHITGQAAFIANSVTNPALLPMFTVLKTNQYFLATYFTVNASVMPYKVDFNSAAFERVATRKFPHQDHPAFNTTGNNAAGITAAKDFMAKTIARLDAAGNCPTPSPAPL